MIGRKPPLISKTEESEPKGFDDYELRLGDVMRGERATMGKSLLDVQRELRIKATYIAAIENCDPSVFDTPGFIAGYVRSYARYLDMDPERCFAAFCAESGFQVAHGMSAEASGTRLPDQSRDTAASTGLERNPFETPNTPFVPEGEAFWHRVEPGAIGSTLVLVGLIGAISFGGWSVLQEVQRVQFAPVDQTPVVLSDLDPLAPATPTGTQDSGLTSLPAPSVEALERLYRPQALDVPVLIARDAPISTLDPSRNGLFAPPQLPQTDVASVLPEDGETPVVPQVIEDVAPQLRVVAVRPAWVRVSGADGTVVFEGIMAAGQSYDVPQTDTPPVLRVGESGSVYFALGDQHFGPAGPRGTVTSGLVLAAEAVQDRFAPADLAGDVDLARVVAEARAAAPEDAITD